MYLSRIEVDLNNRQRIKDLTHLGAYHNWVENSFPEEIQNNSHKRHLWRLDPLSGKQYLLILSENRPDIKLLSRYGVPETALTKPYDHFLDSLAEGQRMRFRLTANPTYSVYQGEGKRSKVYPHVTIEQQRKWLLKKADAAGFQIVSQKSEAIEDIDNLAFDIVHRDRPVLYRKAEKGRTIHISRVTFEGVLQIKNIDVFRQVLISGLGREKAFGMGLMTVIPIE